MVIEFRLLLVLEQLLKRIVVVLPERLLGMAMVDDDVGMDLLVFFVIQRLQFFVQFRLFLVLEQRIVILERLMVLFLMELAVVFVERMVVI